MYSFDPGLLYPYNSSSLAWWDIAQYETCFSGFSLSSNVSTDSADRKCDRGVVLSDHIAFSNSWSGGANYQQLIVQSPTVQGGQEGKFRLILNGSLANIFGCIKTCDLDQVSSNR